MGRGSDRLWVRTRVHVPRRFQSNNFGVTDALLTKLGGGVYPIGALLNHSCVANCVVSYDPVSHAQIIRCLRDVAAGEELTHMYLDAAATSGERRAALRAHYFFECDCAACTSPPGTAPNVDLLVGAFHPTPSLTAPGERRCCGFTQCHPVDVAGGTADGRSEAALSNRDQKRVTAAVKLASTAVACDSVEQERRQLESALATFDRLLHPCNVKVMTVRTPWLVRRGDDHRGTLVMQILQARGALLSACLVQGDHEAAVKHCTELINIQKQVT